MKRIRDIGRKAVLSDVKTAFTCTPALTSMCLFAHITDTTDEILGFLLTLFESLKVQLGPALTEQIVQQLLHTFTRQQLTETLHHESTAGSRVITKFLKILQLLVQEPAASFKAFLPNIIGLCMEQLYPILVEVKNYCLFYIQTTNP